MKKESSDIITFLFRLPRKLDAEIEVVAKREDRTKAAVIRLAIKEYLKAGIKEEGL